MSAATEDHGAEAAILGSIMLIPESLPDVEHALTADAFASVRHRVTFAAMQSLSLKKQPIDILTLSAELEASGNLTMAGGLSYLAALDANVPSPGNVRMYVERVRDRAVRRSLLAAATEIARAASDTEAPISDTMEEAERMILTVASKSAAVGDLPTIGASLKRVAAKIDSLKRSGGGITGLRTGFIELDRSTTGFHPGQMVVLAGRPAMGKSALAMNIAMNVGVRGQGVVVVFSLEMSEDDLTMRAFSGESSVPLTKMMTGHGIYDDDQEKMWKVATPIFHAKVVIHDRADVTLGQMRSICRRVKQRFGALSLVCADYVQLIPGKDQTGHSRENEVAHISRSLKLLAREMECPVLALAQLNRGLEHRENKRPMLSDLRESGAIEQDADIVMFVYRDEVYNPNTNDKGIAEVIIAKQRNGATGTIGLAWRGEITKFDNLAHGTRWGQQID